MTVSCRNGWAERLGVPHPQLVRHAQDCAQGKHQRHLIHLIVKPTSVASFDSRDCAVVKEAAVTEAYRCHRLVC